MQHHEIINEISAGGYTDYLEIGVEQGVTFRQVKIPRKIGVDPDFKFDTTSVPGTLIQQTSDSFFFRNYSQFDCIFIDGLHLYEQVKKDVINSIGRLKPGGVILIDDCFPSDDLAALRSHHECVQKKIARGDLDRNWMGDVYRVIAWLHDFTSLPFCHVAGSAGVIAAWAGHDVRSKWMSSESEIENLSLEAFRQLPIRSKNIQEIRREISLLESSSTKKVKLPLMKMFTGL